MVAPRARKTKCESILQDIEQLAREAHEFLHGHRLKEDYRRQLTTRVRAARRSVRSIRDMITGLSDNPAVDGGLD